MNYAPTPDHVPRRHCGTLISWDEVCWTHDASGFADCGLTVRAIGPITVNPALIRAPGVSGTAEPVGAWR